MRRTTLLVGMLAALPLAAAPLVATDRPTDRPADRPTRRPTDRPTDRPGAHQLYGPPVRLGEGWVRSYVILDETRWGVPLEIGFALDERALDGLPTDGSGHHGGEGPVHEYVVPLPARNPTPFRLLVINWNPGGHEPSGVYDTPHFDFHFYTIAGTERDAIAPSDPRYAEKANRVPTGEYVPPFTAPATPPGVPPAGAAVPLMGVHWSDMRSPELQRMLGNPDAWRPFAATWVVGSWDGRFVFWEPMIARAHLLAKRAATDPAVRDEIVPVPVPARYHVPGHYPTAYRMTYDPQAREYRVALTGLVSRG